MSSDALLEHALEVVGEASRVIGAAEVAIERSERSRLQLAADRGEALGKLDEATTELERARALLSRLEKRLDERPPLPTPAQAAPSTSPPTAWHVAAGFVGSPAGRVTLGFLALALAALGLACAGLAGVDPTLLREILQ